MPQDGNTFYLEDNTFIRHTDDGIKIYKTRNQHPDGPDEMQLLVPAIETRNLIAFILSGLPIPGYNSFPNIDPDADTGIILDEDLEDDDEDDEDTDDDPALRNDPELVKDIVDAGRDAFSDTLDGGHGLTVPEGGTLITDDLSGMKPYEPITMKVLNVKQGSITKIKDKSKSSGGRNKPSGKTATKRSSSVRAGS